MESNSYLLFALCITICKYHLVHCSWRYHYPNWGTPLTWTYKEHYYDIVIGQWMPHTIICHAISHHDSQAPLCHRDPLQFNDCFWPIYLTSQCGLTDKRVKFTNNASQAYSISSAESSFTLNLSNAFCSPNHHHKYTYYNTPTVPHQRTRLPKVF